MSTYNPSVTIAKLYECTSKKGTQYLRGRMGMANIVILKSEAVSDTGQPIWYIKVQEPEQRPEQGADNGTSPARRAENQAAADRGYAMGPDDQIPFAPEFR
jgi:hypothetical protein